MITSKFTLPERNAQFNRSIGIAAPLLSLIFAGFSVLLIAPDNSRAQAEPDHRLSPIVMERAMLGDTYMKIVYGQPYKRNREIFGGLVPYGEVWRTGANEATEITLTGDIVFGGKKLHAGTYSLFTIPEEESWTVIVSRQLGQWGAYRYDESQDVFRFDVPTENTDEVSEPFRIRFSDDRDTLSMRWDRTVVNIPISLPENE